MGSSGESWAQVHQQAPPPLWKQSAAWTILEDLLGFMIFLSLCFEMPKGLSGEDMQQLLFLEQDGF